MTIVLNQRNRTILNAIVRDYIETAEPVGSRALSKKSDIHLSPATIRNIMSDLEDIGLITQPTFQPAGCRPRPDCVFMSTRSWSCDH